MENEVFEHVKNAKPGFYLYDIVWVEHGLADTMYVELDKLGMRPYDIVVGDVVVDMEYYLEFVYRHKATSFKVIMVCDVNQTIEDLFK